MRKILYFFLVCAGIGFIASSVISVLPAFEMLGTGFLISIKENNFNQAYATLSPECQKRIPLTNFQNLFIQEGFTTYKEVKWARPVVSSDKNSGNIIGEVSLANGRKVPFQIYFLKIKSNTFSGNTWFIDDFALGEEVIERQQRQLQQLQ